MVWKLSLWSGSEPSVSIYSRREQDPTGTSVNKIHIIFQASDNFVMFHVHVTRQQKQAVTLRYYVNHGETVRSQELTGRNCHFCTINRRKIDFDQIIRKRHLFSAVYHKIVQILRVYFSTY